MSANLGPWNPPLATHPMFLHIVRNQSVPNVVRNVYVYGYMNIWIYGCGYIDMHTDIWIYGYMDIYVFI